MFSPLWFLSPPQFSMTMHPSSERETVLMLLVEFPGAVTVQVPNQK